MNGKYRTKDELASELFITIDKLFFETMKNREQLIFNDDISKIEEIKRLDLQIAICIQKRARYTKGGFNFIPEEMWDWKPYYPINKKLLPKISRNSDVHS
ncbi:MAG: hypothetical protein CMG60_07345 [Candidatus Marinimicrobia bacterium]|nr:hypothetical protein [Candidatus Neomarinimicrobiota bacterium]|tara:strand:- start:695 stop:994 length:300 start_codon:yes stop_codon:yes gene_type:complete